MSWSLAHSFKIYDSLYLSPYKVRIDLNWCYGLSRTVSKYTIHFICHHTKFELTWIDVMVSRAQFQNIRFTLSVTIQSSNWLELMSWSLAHSFKIYDSLYLSPYKVRIKAVHKCLSACQQYEISRQPVNGSYLFLVNTYQQKQCQYVQIKLIHRHSNFTPLRWKKSMVPIIMARMKDFRWYERFSQQPVLWKKNDKWRQWLFDRPEKHNLLQMSMRY